MSPADLRDHFGGRAASRLLMLQHAYYLNPSSENLDAVICAPGGVCDCGAVNTGLPHISHTKDCGHYPTMMRRDDRRTEGRS